MDSLLNLFSLLADSIKINFAKKSEMSTAITEAINLLKGGVDDDGNSLAKLQNKITAIQTILESDDTTLDTFQELVEYIKSNSDALTLLGTQKVNYNDIINDLDTISSIEGKVLDARQGKILNDKFMLIEDRIDETITEIDDELVNYIKISDLESITSEDIEALFE